MLSGVCTGGEGNIVMGKWSESIGKLKNGKVVLGRMNVAYEVGRVLVKGCEGEKR